MTLPSTQPLSTSGDGFVFNSDLLGTEADREGFRRQHPALLFAFDDPDLRALFNPLEKSSLKAKRRARSMGMLAVALLTGALMTAALDIVFHNAPWFKYLIIAAGIAGVLGVAIAFGGLMMAGTKEKWLRERMVCERLRQLHYQTLVRWAPMILRAAQTGDHAEFLAARAVRTERFRAHVANVASARLSAIVHDRTDEDDLWLVEEKGGKIEPSTEADTLFGILDDMRLRHQANYAELQLRPDTSLSKPSALYRARVLSGFAVFCVLAIVALHFASIFAALDIAMGDLKAPMHVLTLCLAIAALAARTLEEGFQAQREVERYRAYSSGVRLVRQRFLATSDPEAKRAAMMQLEELSYEEMVNFLKAHHEARFVM